MTLLSLSTLQKAVLCPISGKYGTVRQIVGSFGIDIHHASSLDGVDDGAGEFLRNSRTAEARPRRPPLPTTEGSA